MAEAIGEVQSHPVPIASLNPGVEPDSTCQIRAIVTLVWPYSSSTRQTSLLLAEPDFRLRRSKGQVKVNFFGPSARHVGASGVGIGDVVTLGLAGSTWQVGGLVTSTPGRSVDGELVFRNCLALRAERNSETLFEIDANESRSSSSSSSSPSAVSTRSVSAPIQAQTTQNDIKSQQRSDVWSSPVIIRSSAADSPVFDTRFDVFAEEDGYIPGRGRKRTLFGRRSGEWRHVQEDEPRQTPSNIDVSPASSAEGSEREDSLDRADGCELDVRKGKTHGELEAEHGSASQRLLFISHIEPMAGTADGLNGSTVAIGIDTSTQPEAPQPGSALPRTPESPRLLPVERLGLPLVPPLQNGEAELNIDHFTSIDFPTPRPRRTDHAPAARQSTDSTSSRSRSPDFGTDGASYSRQQVEPSRQKSKAINEQSDVRAADLEFESQVTQEAISVLEYGYSNGGSLVPDQGLSPTTDAGQKSSNKELPLDSALIYETQPSEEVDQVEDIFDQFVQQSPDPNEIFPRVRDRLLNTEDDEHAPEGNASDESSHASLIERESKAINQTLSESTPPHSQTQDADHDALPSLSGHSAARALDHSLPPTPARTQSNLEIMLKDVASQSQATAKTIQPGETQPRDQSHVGLAQHQDAPDDHPVAVEKSHPELPNESLKGPNKHKRRSKRSRMTSAKSPSPPVPDIISPWFGLRRSSRRRRASKRAAEMEVPIIPSNIARANSASSAESASPIDAMPKPRIDEGHQQTSKEIVSDNIISRDINEPPESLQTSTAIYSPLVSLDKHLGFADSQGSASVDIFAMVVDNTSKPARSKAGPRDHHVLCEVSDRSVHPVAIEVQCFRPQAASLPSADIGDVIILRNFVVKTRHHSCFLLSAGSSAWHVWRYGKATKDEGLKVEGVKQDCRGPPVELGDEEQDHAKQLRKWWLEVQGKHATEEKSKL